MYGYSKIKYIAMDLSIMLLLSIGEKQNDNRLIPETSDTGDGNNDS
jgi:hypothetical protein